jgi:hypothetical protein
LNAEFAPSEVVEPTDNVMLDSILHHIDKVYVLDLNVDIGDFLVSRETCARLGADPGRSAVLVKQHADEEIELGLYIGEEELGRLTEVDLASNPMSPSSFELLLLAIEEVSHFAYLAFSASREKRVTELELELQAEVDKFVTFTLLHAARNRGLVPRDLLDRMFSDFTLRPGLDSERRERYAAASALASRYCSYVVQSALERERGLGPVLAELRSFYRLSQRGKIGRIHHVVYNS